MGTQTCPNFESKTISSNIKLLQSAVLQSVLTACSGGNFSLRLKGLLTRVKKSHQLSINCISVTKTLIGRPVGSVWCTRCPLAAQSCSWGQEGALLPPGS